VPQRGIVKALRFSAPLYTDACTEGIVSAIPFFVFYWAEAKSMATRTQLINRRNRLTVELHDIRETIADIEKQGVSSFTVSTGDGQKSATNIDLDKLHERRARLESDLADVRRRLRGGSGLAIRHRMTVRG
jgi:hypothetical protein